MQIKINQRDCGGCGDCVAVCPARCIVISNDKAWLDNRRCITCGNCIKACQIDAIKLIDEDQEIADARWRRVVDIISEQLSVDARQIGYNSNIIYDLGADSLDVTELIMAFEEEFCVGIPEEDVGRLMTPGAICQYLKARGY